MATKAAKQALREYLNTLPDFVRHSALLEFINGMTLTPGMYKEGTSPKQIEKREALLNKANSLKQADAEQIKTAD